MHGALNDPRHFFKFFLGAAGFFWTLRVAFLGEALAWAAPTRCCTSVLFKGGLPCVPKKVETFNFQCSSQISVVSTSTLSCTLFWLGMQSSYSESNSSRKSKTILRLRYLTEKMKFPEAAKLTSILSPFFVALTTTRPGMPVGTTTQTSLQAEAAKTPKTNPGSGWTSKELSGNRFHLQNEPPRTLSLK